MQIFSKRHILKKKVLPGFLLLTLVIYLLSSCTVAKKNQLSSKPTMGLVRDPTATCQYLEFLQKKKLKLRWDKKLNLNCKGRFKDDTDIDHFVICQFIGGQGEISFAGLYRQNNKVKLLFKDDFLNHQYWQISTYPGHTHFKGRAPRNQCADDKGCLDSENFDQLLLDYYPEEKRIKFQSVQLSTFQVLTTKGEAYCE